MDNTVRIIGGVWRGRKLKFADVPGLRPTPDRVRETLFNWLNPILPGARCLDCFAGSGALGFEALSRGAAEVVFLDAQMKCITQLKAMAKVLDAPHAIIQQAHLPCNIAFGDQPFDVVFLDPPFEKNYLPKLVEWITPYLAPNAWVYLEAEKNLTLAFMPASWHLHRHKVAGHVQYMVYQVR